MGNASSQAATTPAAAGAYAATDSTTSPDFATAASGYAPAGTGLSHAGAAGAATGAAVQSNPAGRERTRLLNGILLEAKLQCYMDTEDRRVKQLTEGVLYDFLPAALNVMLPNCEDPLQELDADRCRAAATAALAVSSLMNAPPGFLEFLLCIPWRELPRLYPTCQAPGQQTPDQLLAHLAVDDAERRLLVNAHLHPKLMKPVLEFMYKPEHADSVPPLLRPRAVSEQQTANQADANGQAAVSSAGSTPGSCTADAVLLETVAALLDGATPLHCAALRGNPAQVDHLLYCGADPTMRTAAGELAVGLVPVCGYVSRDISRRQCNCLGLYEQEVWECRSGVARNLIARRCLVMFKVGLLSYLSLLWLCLLAMMGLVLSDATLQRPALRAHVQRRRRQRLADAYAAACALLTRMRLEASKGYNYLKAAKHKAHYRQLVQKQQGSDHSSDPGSITESVKLQTNASANPTYLSSKSSSKVCATTESCLLPPEQQTQQHQQCSTGLASAAQQQHHCSFEQPTASRTATVEVGSAGSVSVHGSTENHEPLSSCDYQDEDFATELAFKCYVRAVHALQSLNLQGGILPQLLMESPDVLAAASGSTAEPGLGQTASGAVDAAVLSANAAVSQELASQEQQQLLVLEDEQAELFCCWAESVLLKFDICSCPGCTALAVQAIRMAHIGTAKLFGRMQKVQKQRPQCWRAVGRALSRVVYAHIALLCRTEAHVSPSKASMWRAQQCLQEWDRLAAAGLVSGASSAEEDTQLVDSLRMWAKTAESDLLIAEALLGTSLGPATTLAEALSAALLPSERPPDADHIASTAADSISESISGTSIHSSSTSCLPVLNRPASAALLDQLQAARGLATCPSPAVKQLAAQVANATARELAAGVKLKELIAVRNAPSSGEGVAALAAAIADAEQFSSLAGDVAAARALHQQCCQRAEAAAKLQEIVEQVQQRTSCVSSNTSASACSVLGTTAVAGSVSSNSRDGGVGGNAAGLPTLQGFDGTEWGQCISMLQAAADEAKESNVSVTKARKLIKELQAQLAAADNTAALDACMSRRPCGSSALKAAISKAEAAAAAMATSSNNPSSGGSSNASGNTNAAFSEVLSARLQAAKRRLDVEKASEALHKASVVYKSLADLPKLEAAILNARKVGAEDLAPEEYRAASELRARLTSAARVKQQLDAALKGLAAATSGDAVQLVEAAIKEAERWDELLPGEAARAAEALEAWRASAASEAKLNRALRDGTTASQLSRLISDAAAAGVKVAAAKRVLKLQQLLEAAMAAADDASGGSNNQYGQLAAKLEAAEQGGVATAVLEPGRKLLAKLLACEARQALEAALKPHSDWSMTTCVSTLRAALDKAEDVLGIPVPELLKQQQQEQHDDSQRQQADQNGVFAGVDDSQPQGQASIPEIQRSIEPQQEMHASTSSKAGHCSQPQDKEEQQAGSGSASKLSRSSTMQRTDSMASSSAASDFSNSVGTVSLLPGRQTTADSMDVMCAVAELAVRAWQLWQQHQKQLEEIDREKAEQERTRRELKERERQERVRAEAERAEKGKQERERAAAERRQARARSAAERSKTVSIVWRSAAGSTAGTVVTRAAVQHEQNDNSNSVQNSSNSGSPGCSSQQQLEQQPSVPVHGLDMECFDSGHQDQQQHVTAASAARPATAPVKCHKGSDRISSGIPASTILQSTAPTGGTAVNETPQHTRSDSYELTSKVLAMLGPDLHDDQQLSTSALEPWQHQPNHQSTQSTTPGMQHGRLLHMCSTPSLSAADSRLEGLDLAGVSWQRQQHAATNWQPPSPAVQPLLPAQHQAAGSSSLPASPRFGCVDLGGASWGQPSPTGAAAAPLSTVLDVSSSMEGTTLLTAAGAMATGNGSAGGASAGGDIWGSALGLHVNNTPSAALPPLLSKGLSRVQRSNTEDGSIRPGTDPAMHMAGRQPQQGVLMHNVYNSPAGRVSPVLVPTDILESSGGLHSYGQQHESLISPGQLVSPGHQQYQHQHHFSTPTLMPTSMSAGDYGPYSTTTMDLALLSRSASGGSSSAMLHSGLGLASRQGWGSAQQLTTAAQPAHSIAVSSAGVVAAGIAGVVGGLSSNMGAARQSMSSSGLQSQHQHTRFLQLQQQHQQLLLQLQLQQQHQQLQHLQLQHEQQRTVALASSGRLNPHGAFGGAAGVPVMLGSQVSAAALATPVPLELLPTSSSGVSNQAVGQFSSSFAFGAPGLSAFSQGPAPASSSSSGVGFAASAAALPLAGDSLGRSNAPDDLVVTADAAFCPPVHTTSNGEQPAARVHDAVAQLPDDLGLSQCSPRRLENAE